MAIEALRQSPLPFAGGVVVAPPERIELLTDEERVLLRSRGIAVLPADHPLPTQRNVEAARAVRDCLAPSSQRGVLMLLSGGGSAHLTLPRETVTLEELRAVTWAIQRAGLDIAALNCVRKHLEQLKGGQLAALAFPRSLDVLVLSDVPGDPLDVIASGPCEPDPTTFADAARALNALDSAMVPVSIRALIERGCRGLEPETVKPGDPRVAAVRSRVIGSNDTVCEAAAGALKVMRVDVRRRVMGDIATVEATIKQWLDEHAEPPVPRALVLGGEWTVRVDASDARGGPSQELALRLATIISRLTASGFRSAALCYSTDGIDGPTDAAGAIIDDQTAHAAEAAGIDLAACVARHDAWSTLRSLDGRGALHLRPGPTGTNLNHVAVVVQCPIAPRRP